MVRANPEGSIDRKSGGRAREFRIVGTTSNESQLEAVGIDLGYVVTFSRRRSIISFRAEIDPDAGND